ncbi:MAG: RlmE family RNA methyltransferase [Parvularculales bacterium]
MAHRTHGRGGRPLSTRVRTARGRSLSSTRWLQRQLNDPYVEAARREGYRSRAAWKLLEMDNRHHFLKPGGRVVDLGAAPGGWCQVAARRVRAVEGMGKVIGVDLLPIDSIAGCLLAQIDFLEPESEEIIREMADGPVDVVLSDMAASATGHRPTDRIRVMALAEAAADFAGMILALNGAFCAKVLQGGAESHLLRTLKREFTKVSHVKPRASRPESTELYVLAQGFRGKRVS